MLLLFALLACHPEPVSEPAMPAPADPAFLARFSATHRFSLGTPRSATSTADGAAVLFLRSPPRSFVQDLWELDVALGTERILLTADALLAGGDEALTPEERARRERQRNAARGIASFALSPDDATVLVPLSGRLFLYTRATGAVRELPSRGGPALDPVLSPDGARVSCVRDADLWVTDLASGAERRLTSDGGATVTNGSAEFVAQEEMHRTQGTWWAPDGGRLVFQRTDTAGMEIFRIADPMHPESTPEGWPYPRAGGRNADVQLGVVAATGGAVTWITWDRERYPYVANVTWPPGGTPTLLVQDRRQVEEVLLAADPETGATRTLLTERDDAWLNLVPSMPAWLPDGRSFLWMTERGGAWQLEQRDAGGALIATLTTPEFGLVDVVDVGPDAAIVVASAAPTEKHLWRVPWTGAPTALTSGPGVYAATVARDHRTMIVGGATLAEGALSPRVMRDGEAIATIPSVAEAPPLQPNVTLVEIEAAGTRYHASVVRPRDFVEGRRYPVIVQVYGGPHAQVVQANRAAYLLPQWFADGGFIVVSIDGRGTPARGRAWERAIKGDLATLALDDQVAGLQALGARFPEMDLARVGIQGWSFGGYLAAMAVARRPDVYAAGVAGAPVTDWADYDTHYTERYMGLPAENVDGYAAASVLTYAKDLTRPLLVVHGTSDDNVYFLHSLKLTDALFRAGREFEFLPLSGFTHMVPDPNVTTQLQSRIARFFARSLRGPIGGR